LVSTVLVFCNYPFDPRDGQPDQLLARYRTLSGWARALARTGEGPVAVVQRFGRDLSLERDGVIYRFVQDGAVAQPPAWWWSTRVVQAVAALDPAVVHVHGLVHPLQVRLLRARLPPNTVVLAQDHGGVHAGSPGFGRRGWRWLHRFGLAGADGFLFSADDLARPWQQAAIIGPQAAVHAIPESSTDLADAVPATGRRAPGDPALLWVGRLDRNKDPLTVLTAFEQVVTELPAAELTMVFGAGALLPRVRARIASAPALARRVHLLGQLDASALPALYASADLFVLGSHHEGSGYALIESLAFGAAPVVSDIPSFRTLTDGGRLGALFPVGDARACAAAILRLSRDPAGRPARREAIRSHFARALSWPALAARARTIYRTASERRARLLSG
jgi:glycosyltransferase involved in cell wall biosynthesis